MDTFSHALWGKGLFGYRKFRPLASFFGAFHDLSSFGIYFFYNLIFNFKNFQLGKPTLDSIPFWVPKLYDFSHSLIIAGFFLIIMYFIGCIELTGTK